MPDWVMGPVCLIGLVGFIFYAFRQGFSVKPDRNNKNVGPTTNDTWLASGRGSEDGHTL